MDLPINLMPDEASPDWMNKGDNAWQMTAATLVGLQSIPGLVILYGSIVKKKWAVNSAFMALYAFAAVLVCWVGWGYRMSFATDHYLPFLGKPACSLDQKFLLSQAFSGKFPTATMVFFQFVFAAITLILIAGALLGRMNFHAWMVFVPLWLTFSYTIGAFSIWSPNGWLFKRGLIDYSGGFVIHLSSGVAGFTAAYWVINYLHNIYPIKQSIEKTEVTDASIMTSLSNIITSDMKGYTRPIITHGVCFPQSARLA